MMRCVVNKRVELIISILFVFIVSFLINAHRTLATDGYPERINVTSDGNEVDQGGGTFAVSEDGRYVVFDSMASNLVPGDTNGTADIFVRDRQQGTTERISVAYDGSETNNFSTWPSISADGRYVAFASKASNLTLNDANDLVDIFVRDRQQGTTERISVAYDGSETMPSPDNNGDSSLPSISSDGRYVVFDSHASNLVPGDTNGTADIFVRDRQQGTTERISVAYDGSEVPYSSDRPSISADGRYVAFESAGANLLVPNDTIIESDGVFVRDRQLGTIEHISVAPDGTEGNAGSNQPIISANGRYVVFESIASNLIPEDTTWGSDNGRYFFIRDRETGITEKAIVAPDGTIGNGSTAISAISADGRYLTFSSNSSNLVPGDTNGTTPPTRRMGYDVFVYDRESGSIKRVSVASDGTEGNTNSGGSTISSDGHYIVFASDASNLVPDDTNSQQDIFLTLNPFFGQAVQNQSPVLSPIGNQIVQEGQTLTFTLSATDPDSSDILTYSSPNLPQGAFLDSSSGVFTWTPAYDQSGNFTNIELTVTDNGTPNLLDTELITITVGDVNRAPEFSLIPSQEVLANETLTFTVSATDPDGGTPTYSANQLPTGATFDPSTRVFSWTPTTNQAGNYTVIFNASDNGSPVETGTLEVPITVGDNPTPPEEAATIVATIVNDPNLSASTENAYLANLQKVKVFIEQGKITAAINQLDAFIQKVTQDFRHEIITQQQKDTFLNMANDLKNDLQ